MVAAGAVVTFFISPLIGMKRLVDLVFYTTLGSSVNISVKMFHMGKLKGLLAF
jgi:hypothetical protein